MNFDRDRAMLDVTSVLGDGVLLASAVSVREEISQPFDIRVTLLSERDDIQAEELLHQPMTVTLRHDGVPVRYFHGIAQSFSVNGAVDGRGLTAYEARLVPRFWFLSQTVDCRIFQKRTVTEITNTLFQDAGFPAPKFRLKAPHQPREYITQYNESDFDFLSRHWQEEGAFYFFVHTESDHEMVIADHNGAFTRLSGGDLRFDSASADDAVLLSWQNPHGTTHGRMRIIDYDPSAPKKRLDANQPTVLRAGGATRRDVFRWPVLSFEPGRVGDMARFRMEAEEAAVSLITGHGRCRDMEPGSAFTLEKDPLDGGSGKQFVVHSVTHEAWDNTFLSGDEGSGYENRFTVFPFSLPWRESFAVPRPRMEGVHAALVIGPQGEEIHTDDLGRVKVMFFWDHRREAHPDHAIWARVVYPWAGNGWGWQSTPRIGTEVAVAFMDGDPDRPVVLGGMYNGNDTPIYSEKEKTKSGIRTRSSLKGSTQNFNELTFDDKKGEELIYIQAEKDMRICVKHDQRLQVDNNRRKIIGVNETITVGNHRTATVERGNDSLTVDKGDRSATISKGNDSLAVKLGNIKIDAAAGKIDISAMQSITLTVGNSCIKMDQIGITISGIILKVDGMAMLQTSAPLTTQNAAAMMILKAGLMTLN